MLAKLRLLSAVVLALTSLLTNAFVVDRDAARITLPVVKRVNMTSTAKLLEIDQARVRALRARAEGPYQADSPPGFPVTNQVISYIAEVDLGSQPGTFNLIVDTGSANTWAGAQLKHPYLPNGRIPQGTVAVEYGSGGFVGNEYLDMAILGLGLTIQNQSIGAATLAGGFNSGVDGILGIGPSNLTCGTVITVPPTDGCQSTVTDNAFTQGLITTKEVCISFGPTTTASNTNGELTFGGSTPSKYIGSLEYVPITSTSSASDYVGINQTIAYGNKSILTNTAGIVDSGTTLILLTTGAYDAYKIATNATEDSATGLLKIAGNYTQLESLFFTIGGTTYELNGNGQTWPRALNAAIGGQPNSTYLVVGNLGTVSGFDFILGQTWLERIYHCYDSQNNRAGFATTPFTHATTN